MGERPQYAEQEAWQFLQTWLYAQDYASLTMVKDSGCYTVEANAGLGKSVKVSHRDRTEAFARTADALREGHGHG